MILADDSRGVNPSVHLARLLVGGMKRKRTQPQGATLTASNARRTWLAGQLAQVYPPGDARVWLFSPHRDLGGERPVDLIAEDRMDEVLAIIDRLQSASYT